MTLRSLTYSLVMLLSVCSCLFEEEEPDTTIHLLKVSGEGTGSFQYLLGSRDGSEQLSSVKQRPGSGYVFCGSAGDYYTSGIDVFVVTTDESGETEWIRQFSNNKNDRGWDVEITGEDQYMVAATSQQPLWSVSSPVDILLVGMDGSGNKIWDQFYSLEGPTGFIELMKVSDSASVVYYSTLIEGEDNVFYQGYLLKNDLSGNEIWKKELPQGVFYSCEVDRDGGFVLCGLHTREDSGQPDIYVVKTDPQGDTLWTRYFDHLDHPQPGDICLTDRGYAICGKYDISMYASAGFVLALDEDGWDLWTREYDPLYIEQDDPENNPGPYGFMTRIIETDDGELAAIGQESNAVTSTTYMVKLAARNGDIVWDREYDPGHQAALLDIQQTLDGGYIMAGSAGGKGYIVKTDENGN